MIFSAGWGAGVIETTRYRWQKEQLSGLLLE